MFFRNYLSSKKKKKQWLCVWSKLFRALSVGSTHYRALLNSSEWVLGRFAKHYFSKPPTYQKDVRYQQSASVCNSNFNDGKFPMENWKISPNLGSILSCRERESEKERLLIISAHLVVGIDIKAEAVVNLLPCYKSSGSKMEIQRLKVLIEGPVLAVTAVKGN